MRFAAALLSAIVPALSAAQEPQAVEAERFVPINPIERSNPSHPTRALQYGNEGWVMLSFVVTETGEVEEPMIEDSSGVEAFESAALEAVSRWRYTPATVNGEPVA
jgi:TonB family protein